MPPGDPSRAGRGPGRAGRGPGRGSSGSARRRTTRAQDRFTAAAPWSRRCSITSGRPTRSRRDEVGDEALAGPRRPAADRPRLAALGRRRAAARRPAPVDRPRARLRPGRGRRADRPARAATPASSPTRRRTTWPRPGSRPRGGTVLHGDASVLPWGTTYDVVCAFEVLEHIDGRRGRARGLARPTCARAATSSSRCPRGPSGSGPPTCRSATTGATPRPACARCWRRPGCEVTQVVHYGWPLGYLLERVSNRAASRAAGRPGTGDAPSAQAEQRSAGSGRWLQPGALTGAALRVGVLPFAAVQGRRTDGAPGWSPWGAGRPSDPSVTRSVTRLRAGPRQPRADQTGAVARC